MSTECHSCDYNWLGKAANLDKFNIMQTGVTISLYVALYLSLHINPITKIRLLAHTCREAISRKPHLKSTDVIYRLEP
jgi:hypothetical protein